MSEQTKNYASLRGSKSFGESSDKISLRFNKEDFLTWVQKLKADEKGCFRIIIAPRREPSEVNKFTVFEDTWKPQGQRMSGEQVREGMKPAREAARSSAPPEDKSDDVPF